MKDLKELAKTLIVVEFVIIFIFGMVDVLTGITWDGYAMIYPNNFINEATNLQALGAAGVIFLLFRNEGNTYSRYFLASFALYLTFFAVNEQFGMNAYIDPLLPPLPHHMLNTMFEWSWTNMLLAITIVILILLFLVRSPFPEQKRKYLLYGAFWQFSAFFCFLVRPNAADEPQPITLIAYAKETSELLSTFFYLLFFLLIFLAKKRSTDSPENP